MIIDYERFIQNEKPYWDELQGMIGYLDEDIARRIDMDQIERFHYLYQRTAGALPQLSGIPAAAAVKAMLEKLVSRAYAEIHATESRPARIRPSTFILHTFPDTFRRWIGAFQLALLTTLIGALFGAFALAADDSTKHVLLPFSHLHGDPSERVSEEESLLEDVMEGRKSTFSAYLMTHNIRVSIFCFAMGITWGAGTLILLFYNGVILGAICFDYVLAGETSFLLGWLLPHGVIEIPAILIAAQAGFVLAGALIGRNSGLPLRDRIQSVSDDILNLVTGSAIMLVWAGIVEAFLSQYHEPFIPYGLKILFGVLEFIALYFYLTRCGMKSREAAG